MNLDQLVAIMQAPRLRCMMYLPLLAEGMAKFGIVGEQPVACFLATIGHESAGLTYTREIWGPTPAQERYEGRADLGNTERGDGPKFRGRGLIQLTGKANYQAAGTALGVDLVSSPDQVAAPEYAALTAGWFWDSHKLNALADKQDNTGITKAINARPSMAARWGWTTGWRAPIRRWRC